MAKEFPVVMKLERTICGKCIHRSMVSELVRKKWKDKLIQVVEKLGF